MVTGRIEKTVPESGLIERCPECRRVVYNGHCVVHVDEDPEPDLRLKGKIAGGNEVVTVNKDLAEDILGITFEEAQAIPEQDLLNIIRNRFVGNKFKFQGHTLNNDNFIADEYERRQQ